MGITGFLPHNSQINGQYLFFSLTDSQPPVLQSLIQPYGPNVQKYKWKNKYIHEISGANDTAVVLSAQSVIIHTHAHTHIIIIILFVFLMNAILFSQLLLSLTGPVYYKV